MPVTFRRPSHRRFSDMAPVLAPAQFRRPAAHLRPPLHQVARFRPTAWFRGQPHHPTPAPEVTGEESGPAPFVGLQRHFTPEGGIEYAFLAHDERFWAHVLRFLGFAWTMTMTVTLQALAQPGFSDRRMPEEQLLANAAIFLGALVFFGWYFFRRHYLDSTIEIRKDCMILDGNEIFWRRLMWLGWPAVAPQPDGTHVFQVTYGDRFIQFYRLERTGPEDHFPELLAAQLQFAMQQLWRE